MKQRDTSNIPSAVLAQAKRRCIVACVLSIPLAPASVLWGASGSPNGIQTEDIVWAIVAALVLTALAFAAWPHVVRNFEEQYANPTPLPDNDSVNQEGHESEA